MTTQTACRMLSAGSSIGVLRITAWHLALASAVTLSGCAEQLAAPSQPPRFIAPQEPQLTIDPGWTTTRMAYSTGDEGPLEFNVPSGTAGSSANSRCPDQHLQNPAAVYPTNRLHSVSVTDPADNDKLVHFSGLETKYLRFLNYESQGPTYSYATFELLTYWLSNDQKYQASPGAKAFMRCKNGGYTEMGMGTLIYTGATHLMGLSPIQRHWQDESPIDCDDPMTEIVETECSPGGGGPHVYGQGGESVDPGVWNGGTIGTKWVCMVTYWYHYHSNGERHYYDATIDYCWLEEM